MECEFSAPEKTREEVEELKRSTKKIKEDHPPGSSTASVGGLVSETVSYKARLVGEIPGAYAQAFEVNSNIRLDDESDDEVGDL